MNLREMAFTLMFVFTLSIMLYLLGATVTGYVTDAPLFEDSAAGTLGTVMLYTALFGTALILGKVYFSNKKNR